MVLKIKERERNILVRSYSMSKGMKLNFFDVFEERVLVNEIEVVGGL